MTFSQSPAWGRAVEWARALERRSGAEESRRLREASSMQLERGHARHGTSMSLRELQSGLLAATARANTEALMCCEGTRA